MGEGDEEEDPKEAEDKEIEAAADMAHSAGSNGWRGSVLHSMRHSHCRSGM